MRDTYLHYCPGIFCTSPTPSIPSLQSTQIDTIGGHDAELQWAPGHVAFKMMGPRCRGQISCLAYHLLEEYSNLLLPDTSFPFLQGLLARVLDLSEHHKIDPIHNNVSI